MKGGLAAVANEDVKKFLFIIPLQVGPATPYARNLRDWMHGILVFQAVVCILRFAVLLHMFGGLWMAAICGLGWFAWYHEMNITYICSWGLACAVNGIMDVAAIIIPLVWGALTFQFLSTTVRVLIPFSELLGAGFAWHLYLDYEHNVSHGEGLLENVPDPMAKFINEEGVKPDEYKGLLGHLHGQQQSAVGATSLVPPELQTEILQDLGVQQKPQRKKLACC
mmetsp:Transcript_41631/g.107720  ORF Transcript_41631/g.107720 Transcript_41631/m.107720 type:complete len:223 (+) Transcript_41631:145-813(+)